MTVTRQSTREAWSNFNVGRKLFTYMADYDRNLARLLTGICQTKKVIVEYGCGDGIWTEYLAKQFPKKQFIGVEWNQNLADYARTKRFKGLSNVTLYQEDATQFYVDCDLFFAFGVVEHFNEASDIIKHWTNHLSPNGFAVITAPNLLNSIYNSRRFKLSLEEIQDKNEVIVNAYGFEQLWSHNTFLQKIMDAGLEILLFRILEEQPSERSMLAVAFKRPKRGETNGKNG